MKMKQTILKLEPYADQSATLKFAQENVESVYKIGKPIEEIKSQPEVAKSKFKVGDRVRLINAPGYCVTSSRDSGLAGNIGTIVGDLEYCPKVPRHDCPCKSYPITLDRGDEGIWRVPDCIELVENDPHGENGILTKIKNRNKKKG